MHITHAYGMSLVAQFIFACPCVSLHIHVICICLFQQQQRREHQIVLVSGTTTGSDGFFLSHFCLCGTRFRCTWSKQWFCVQIVECKNVVCCLP